VRHCVILTIDSGRRYIKRGQSFQEDRAHLTFKFIDIENPTVLEVLIAIVTWPSAVRPGGVATLNVSGKPSELIDRWEPYNE